MPEGGISDEELLRRLRAIYSEAEVAVVAVEVVVVEVAVEAVVAAGSSTCIEPVRLVVGMMTSCKTGVASRGCGAEGARGRFRSWAGEPGVERGTFGTKRGAWSEGP